MDDAIIKQAKQERDAYLRARGTQLQHKDSTHQDSVEPKTDLPKLLSIDEILTLPDEQETWLVESIILNNGITIVSGLPNHYKSFFVQFLVKAIAAGTPFLDTFRTQQGSVLIIDREIPTKRLKRRWSTIGGTHRLPIFFYPYSEPFKLDNRDTIYHLTTLVAKNNIKLLVIDTFNRSHSGKDLSSPSDVARVFEPLKAILETTSVVLIHHSNKSGFQKDVPTPEELLGSIDFLAETDSLFTLRKKDKNTVIIHNLKSRDSEMIEPFTLDVKTYQNGIVDLIYKGTYEPEETPAQNREQLILDFLKAGEKLKQELIAHLRSHNETIGTVENTLTVLKKRNLIGSKKKGKEAYYFLLDTDRNSEQERFPNSSTIGFGEQGDVQENPITTSKDVSQLRQETYSASHRDLIQQESKKRNALLLLDRNSHEYQKQYLEWFALRERGVQLRVFPFFVPGNND